MSGYEMIPGSIFSLTNHEMYVVTARAGDRENGQIATWVIPATLVSDEPRIIAALSPLNYTHTLILDSGRFVLNMLSTEQSHLVPLFGLLSGRDIDKLDELAIERTSSGLPVLGGTCGWAECRIVASIDAGDRMIYLADIVEQRIRPNTLPLRKREAFAAQPDDIRTLLEEKQHKDALRDKRLIRRFTTD